jgi:hypothetical protein
LDVLQNIARVGRREWVGMPSDQAGRQSLGEAAIVSLSVCVRELPKRHVKPPTSEYRVIRSRLESGRGSNAQGLRTEHRTYEMSKQKWT